MYKINLKNKRLTLATALILAMILFVSLLTTMPIFAYAADNPNFGNFTPESLAISNPQFADASGSTPQTPDSWTGAAIESGEGASVKGVMNVKNYFDDKNDEKYKLDRYPEYENVAPQTPFGTSKYPSTNSNVLMINTNGNQIAYGYTSSSMTFEPNKFYRVSVWAKTGNFSQGQGAVIKLDGLGKDVAFRDINTVSKLSVDVDGNPILTEDNNYGFKEYEFLVASSPLKSSTVTLKLQVGDKYTDDDDNYLEDTANGYAFFDNITAQQISPEQFAMDITLEKQNRKVFNFIESEVLTNDNGDTIGDFSDGEKGWTRISDGELVEGTVNAGVYNANAFFSEENTQNAPYGLAVDPYSPFGKTDNSVNNNIFVMSSYSNGSYKSIAAAYKSTDILIERHSFYRISVWVKTQNADGELGTLTGDGAIAAIRGDISDSAREDKLDGKATALAGDNANMARFGWKEQSFYVKGSALRDNKVHVELGLGSIANKASGIAMFDDVRVQRISAKDFNEAKANGTEVTIDGTLTETGVTNGDFDLSGDYEDYVYPMMPSGWTKYTTDTAATTDYSNIKVELDDKKTVGGIVPTETSHYTANRPNYLGAAYNLDGIGFNVLMMASLEETAFCYRSSAVTVAASTSYRLTVNLRAEDIVGYGASIVLKDGSNVIASIENITETAGFENFTFLIEGGSSEKTVSVEIWLGLIDREDNSTKLSKGFVFVDTVSFAALAEGETYADLVATNKNSKYYSSYSFNKEDFSAYDHYDSNAIKYPYNWTLQSGANHMVTYGIRNTTLKGENYNELYLKNASDTSSTLKLRNTYTLEATSYYTLSVTLKTKLPQANIDSETSVGANITISGTDYKFENIKKTSTFTDKNNPETEDKETYKTFVFYINTNSQTPAVGLEISLGDSSKPNKGCTGEVFVKDITLEKINNVVFEEISDNYTKYENDTKGEYSDSVKEQYKNYYKIVAYEDTTEETPEDTEKPGCNAELSWWVLPSILLGLCIVVAIVGFGIRRIAEKRSRRKTVTGVSSYDRRITLHKTENEKNTDGVTVPTLDIDTKDTAYDEFNEDTTPRQVKDKQDKEKPVAKVDTIEQANTADTDDTAATVLDKTDTADLDEFDDSKPTKEKEEKPAVAKDAYENEFDD